MTTLFVVTGSYPFSVAAENTFLPQELAVLSRHFEKIVVVPLSTEGARDDIGIPNVEVDTEFASYTQSRRGKWMRLMSGLIDPELLKECGRHRSLFAKHPRALRNTIGYYVRSKMMEAWTRQRLSARQTGALVLYTWWFDAPTLGLARIGKQRDIPVISRAHGYDLYESRHAPPYIPFRDIALEKIDRVFPDSEAGARYLARRYPFAASKVKVGLLGISDPGFLNASSSDGVFRVVSCSFLTPVKRIDLLIRGLAKVGEDCPSAQLSWVHLGDGPERSNLETLSGKLLPSNVQWLMPGYPGRDGLYDFYRNERVDLFVNVSESEGTPISIIEALSVGIPVLCTAVGGNTETVGNGNGLLMESNPTPKQVSESLRTLMRQPGELRQMRGASREHWERKYDAARNYADFAELIKA